MDEPSNDTEDTDSPQTYDPRRWLGASPPNATQRETEREPDHGTRGTRIVLVSAALTFAIAAGAFLALRQPLAHAPDRPAASFAASESTRVMALDDTRRLARALASTGLGRAQAQAATAALSPRLATLGGPLTLDVRLGRDAAGEPALLRLTLERDDGSGLRLDRQAARYRVSDLTANLARRIRVISAQMDRQGFYSSAVTAGVDDRLISKIAAAFAYDFDFARDIAPRDSFVAVTQDTVNARGETVAEPALLYVSLSTQQKSRAFYRFQPAFGAASGWYDASGRNAQRSLMRTPVDGARVTSGFGMRIHPILGYARLHRGIDFGTPVGTPVYAAGYGVVAAMGPRGGYGNYLRIDHSAHLSTAYGHLLGYPPGIKIGMAVDQGRVVAFSGNTGESTGPHLHFEVIVNGEQIDPATYNANKGTELTPEQMQAFAAQRDRIDRLRDAAAPPPPRPRSND
jgi:murein DD-endopeptidase MepM/ murein hydrolase activator NlpD